MILNCVFESLHRIIVKIEAFFANELAPGVQDLIKSEATPCTS